jgi:hypothetical protein
MSSTFKLVACGREIDADGGAGWAVAEVTGTFELVFRLLADSAGTHLGDVVTANLEPSFLRKICEEMLLTWFDIP